MLPPFGGSRPRRRLPAPIGNVSKDRVKTFAQTERRTDGRTKTDEGRLTPSRSKAQRGARGSADGMRGQDLCDSELLLT